VYGIVKQSGGLIRAYSEIGAGTSFEIYFPAASTIATTDDERASDESPRGHETVLVAEDQPEVRAVIRSLLTRRGYHVIVASNGAEALRLATRQVRPIDLLITDVVMPGINGPDLAAALQSMRPGLRVLFASGYPEHRREQHGSVPAGAPFISKPFLPSTLLAKVRKVLDSPVTQRA
jgi:CheY-like chemotaxis protein